MKNVFLCIAGAGPSNFMSEAEEPLLHLLLL